MQQEDINLIFTTVTKKLSNKDSLKNLFREPRHNELVPSVSELKNLVEVLRQIIFPGFFGNSAVKYDTLQYYLGVNLDRVYKILTEQIKRGLCFSCSYDSNIKCDNCVFQAEELACKFMENIPNLRELLSYDVKASFEGDPASKGIDEVIFCFPAIKALTNYRIANCLLKLNIPLLPRIISELAHSETGIDIHPGAEIGKYFTIDHGTGTVIGETCVIGNNVKLYQGVTLGAKSFPLDENGNPIKGIPRHPIVEDGVVIYAHATILGRITIGANSIIGGNVWITNDLPPNSRVVQQRAKENLFIDGGGI